LLSVLHNGANDGATYSYDLAGNRISKQNVLTGISETYTYDLIYELTQVTQAVNTTESYSYDPAGNRLSSLLGQYAYNTSNELTAFASNSYAYDKNGNMLSKTNAGSVTSYVWDWESRLSSIALPSNTGTIGFRYDPFGRRIQKTSPNGVTIYLYDGQKIAAEISSTGSVMASYAQGAGIDEPLAMQRGGNAVYYHADALGSVTSFTNASAQTVATYVYDSFGNTTATEGISNSFRYTGREDDSVRGLYYYRARYYDPSIGRFISEDPIGFRGGRNFYAYVGNNPILFRDPSGLCYTAWDKGVIIATFCLTGGDPDLIPGPEGPTDSTDSPSPVNGQNPTHSPGPDGGALGLQIANCIAKVLALPSCDTKPCKPSAQGHVIPSH